MDSAGLVRLARLGSLVSEKRVLVSGLEPGLGDALIHTYNPERILFCCCPSGSFNNWTKMRMNRSTKDFVAIVDLQEGEHEYKFFADGEWVTDKAVETIENPGGIKNNVIR